MLERTAATLESCTSLHALPSATQSLRSRRKLHTGFWQHGAAAIDISSPALSMYHNEADLPASEPPSAPIETLASSTFLLDFLYPNGAAAFMRRFAPGLHDRQASPVQRLPRPRPRLFTSSAVVASKKTSDTPEVVAQAASPHTTNDGRQESDRRYMAREHGESGTTTQEEPDTAIDEELDEELDEDLGEDLDEDLDLAGEADAPDATQTHSGPSFAGSGSRPELMRELMATKDTEYFGSIWQLYYQLEPHLQPEFRPEIIEYLYRSANMIDARRVILLFAQIDDSQWTPAVLTSAVKAHLRLGNETRALDLYQEGLEEKTMVGGLDELLHYAFSRTDWGIVKEVWASYHAIFTSHGIKAGRLDRLAAVPNLGERALLFAEEVKELKNEEERNAPTLDILLKKVARRALQQPCKPQEALPLLRIVDQVKWYNIYLSEAINRGQRECLPEIYRIYRDFPGTKPYWGILHGMFEIFYPDDVTGLEQVYEDYHVSYGGLDQWGFRKFLKFYASRGDIKSLQRLWDNYAQTYKHRNVLQEPETFNHILNTYATMGDVQDAQRVFNEMMSKYKVTPSIHSWNILLKSHVQSRSYDSALAVFDELCETVSPDPFTFATIMSLTAVEGDLDKTLELFKMAANSRIKIDTPIVHALVEAYCRNSFFSEALATCSNAKRQGIPGEHAKLWNTLLRHHAERRAFGTVCRVVTIMAELKVDWTSDTHNVLFQALVRCRQTHHAYSLLRKARRDNTFTLTPEHFSTVMDGGLRTHELGLVDATSKMMQRTGSPLSVDAMILQVDAMVRQQLYGRRETMREVAAKEMLTSYIQELIDVVKTGEKPDSSEGGSIHGSVRSAHSLQRLRRTLTKAISLFEKYRDFYLVRELHQLQVSLGLQKAVTDVKNVAIDMLATVLKENVDEKKYDAAKSTWELIWQRALRLGRPELYTGKQILPRHRYILSGPVRTMQQMFLDLKDPKGFKTLIDELLAAGFKLDRRSMNHACQTLANMGYWMEACELCETHLMRHFTGWKLLHRRRRTKPNIPLETRRVGSAPQKLRPISYTLITLAKEYMEVKAEAPWSPAVSEKARIFKERCPRLVSALDTIKYSGVGIEEDVFGHRYEDDAPAEGEVEERGYK